jgi:hypothetical protein
MNFFKKYKSIIIVLVILIIATVAYTVIIGEKDDSLLVSESSVDISSASQGDLLALLLEIRTIKLDESILSDEAFRSLKDFGQEIVPEPVGRENPFAPVNFDELSEEVVEE